MARAPMPYDYLPKVPSFAVESDDVADGRMLADAHLSDGFGLPGSNTSPHLRWSGYPPETRSFGVTCLDPDAPTGSGFWHLALFDLPADVTELARGAAKPDALALPAGSVCVRNDAGFRGYCGAAPAKGDEPHRYVFAVHALGCAALGLDADASPALVGYLTSQHILARALLTPVFGH